MPSDATPNRRPRQTRLYNAGPLNFTVACLPRTPSSDCNGSFEARLRWLQQPGNRALLQRGLRGVEEESLRVGADGRLSHRPHPPKLGAALTHPYLTTDYSESLPEFVTAPRHSNWETLQFLCDLHAFVHRRLEGELLWPASMPCVLNADRDIPIAYYGSPEVPADAPVVSGETPAADRVAPVPPLRMGPQPADVTPERRISMPPLPPARPRLFQSEAPKQTGRTAQEARS